TGHRVTGAADPHAGRIVVADHPVEGGAGVGVHRPVVGVGPRAGVGHEDEVDPGDRLTPGQVHGQPRFATGVANRGAHCGADVARRGDFDAFVPLLLHGGHRFGVDAH